MSQIDFVYGNFPIQPNAGRTNPVPGRLWDALGTEGPEDAPGPNPTGSPTLEPDLDNHNIVYDEYNGYPDHEPTNPVPDVVGLQISLARQILQRHGFRLGDVTTEAQGEWRADWVVVSQTVAAGTIKPIGTEVGISTIEEEEDEEEDEEEGPIE